MLFPNLTRFKMPQIQVYRVLRQKVVLDLIPMRRTCYNRHWLTLSGLSEL